MRKILLSLLVLASIHVSAQWVTIDTVMYGLQVKATFDRMGDSTEGMAFFPGAGEVGTDYDPAKFDIWGPHYWIKNGWGGYVTLGNGQHRPILLTIRMPSESQRGFIPATAVAVRNVIYAFKVKRKAVHGIGISNGVQWMMGIGTYQEYLGDTRFLSLFTSMTDIQGMNPTDSGIWGVAQAWPDKIGYWAKRFGGRFIGFEQTGDTRNIQKIVKNIEDSAATAYFYWTIIGNKTHGYFNDYLDTTQRNWASGNPIIQDRKPSNSSGFEIRPFAKGWNLFEAILRQGDTTLPGGNRPPTVMPVNNQTITLPANSVSVSSSAADPESGTLAYSWTKISGSGTASSPTSTSTNITGLTAGVSEWEFRATDPEGLYATARFTITVNEVAANQQPVVTVDPVPSVTYPTNTITVTVSSTDPDGTIESHIFRPESGATYTIVSPSINTTDITGLPLGSSRVYYTAFDDYGDSTRVVITMQVNQVSSGSNKSNTATKVMLAPTGSTKVTADPAWNIWAPSSWSTYGIKSQAFNNQFGQATNITALLSVSSNISDNTTQAGYPGTISVNPPEIVNYASNSSQQIGRDFTIAGLEQGKKYDIVLHAIRYTNTATSNTYTLNGVTHTVRVDYGSAAGANTTMKPDTFAAVTPNADGAVLIKIGRPSTFNYLSGFEVIELASEGGNLLPVANAGTDKVVKLPTTSVQLDGSGSLDQDGSIASYAWAWQSGPNTPSISGGTTATPTISGLVPGVYVYRLTVTDDGGAVSFADVKITVLYAGNSLPIANAGVDTSINRNSYTLIGAINDLDGTVDPVYTKWENISGPSPVVIKNPTSLSTEVSGMYLAGNYYFRLTGRDNEGAAAYDTVIVNVTISTTFDCKAEAGQNVVIDANTSNSFAVLDGSLSIGVDSARWKLITSVDFPKWKARIINPTSLKAYALIFPYKDGGYNYELTVWGPAGCVSKDTVNVYRARNPSPQGVDGTRSGHLVTSSDTALLHSLGVSEPVIGKDWWVPGANTENTAIGKTAIAMGSELKLEPGARIFIMAGDYAWITIKPDSGAVVGTPEQPIVITNVGGQVRAGYMTLQNVVHAKLTGKYVPGVSGHKSFRGHDAGTRAYVADKYGFDLNNRYASLVSVGLKIDGYFTNYVEVEYVAVRNGNFAGVQIKQDDRNNTMYGINVHDCYIENTHGEGVYTGSTKKETVRHSLQDFKFKNNLLVNAGNEIIQINNNSTGAAIMNNVAINSATNYQSPFNVDQSMGLQSTFRGGKDTVENNMFDGTAFQDVNYYQAGHDSVTVTTDTVFVQNNYFRGGRGRYGGVINMSNNPPSGLLGLWKNNWFSDYGFTADRVYMPGQLLASNSNYLFQVLGSSGTIKMRDSYYDGSKSLFMVPNNIVDTAGMQLRTIAAPKYKNSGWPYGFSYRDVAEWAYTIYSTWGDENTTTRNTIRLGDSVYYQINDLVIWMGSYYRSRISDNFGHMPTGKTDQFWELLTWQWNGETRTTPPNDYRLADDDPYKELGIGLMDSVSGGPVTPPPNQAPTLISWPPANQTISSANSIQVKVEAADNDGTIVDRRLVMVNGPDSYFSIENAGIGIWNINFSGTVTQKKDYSFEIQVEDNAGAVSSVRFNVTILPKPAGPPKTLTERSVINLNTKVKQ
ncbi:MAG: PKD domain-containing protein [Chitinophagaceae bacterium]